MGGSKGGKKKSTIQKHIDNMAFVRELKQDAEDSTQYSIRLIAAEDSTMSTMVNGLSLAQGLAQKVTAPSCE